MNTALLVLLLFPLVLSAAPTVRAQPPALSPPERDFEAFWTVFHDHYAFFPQKEVDWKSVHRRFRGQVSAQTTEAELTTLLGEMVEPLHDGHITLAREETVFYKGESTRNTFKQTFKPVLKEFWSVAYQQLRDAGFTPIRPAGPKFKGVSLLYTARTKDVGYLHLTRCFAELTGVMGTPAQEGQDQRLLLTLMRQALAQMAGCQTILIDVRDNGGGHSGYEMAGLFSDHRILSNYKATRLVGDYDHFTTPEPFYLVPAPGPRYTRPLVLLTSDQTASAAEDFTLALSRRANVARVGTATKGMMSDMFNAALPSGLQITLSNQRYTSVSGQVLEDVGVAPTVQVENTRAALDGRQDPVITKALEVAARQLKPHPIPIPTSTTNKL